MGTWTQSFVTIVALATVATLAACGDDSNAQPDAGTRPDGSTNDGSVQIDAAVDAAVCPLPPSGEPGSTCTTSAECDSSAGAGDGVCVATLGTATDSTPDWPAEGYCVISNCLNNDGCPGTSVCIDINSSPLIEELFCVAACCDGGTCGTGFLCNDSLQGGPIGELSCFPGAGAAKDGDTCQDFGDCNVSSLCREGFEGPGGYCFTSGCTIGDNTTCAPGGDGVCVDDDNNPDTLAQCFDACAVDADCRVAEGYRCIDHGANGGLYCRHPKVGEACAINSDCGNTPWECNTNYPGGYCTVTPCTVGSASTCPAASQCYDADLGGPNAPFCHDECNLADPLSCRAGYTCTSTGNRAVCLPTPS